MGSSSGILIHRRGGWWSCEGSLGTGRDRSENLHILAPEGECSSFCLQKNKTVMRRGHVSPCSWEHLSAAPEELKEVGPERKLWTSIVRLRSCGPRPGHLFRIHHCCWILFMFSPGPPPFLQHCSMCVCLLLALKNRINIVEVFLTPSFHQLPSAETKRDLALFGLRRVFPPPHYINIQGGGGLYLL